MTRLRTILNKYKGKSIKFAKAVKDNVNHPAQYTQGAIECIEAIESALGPEGFIAFLQGQVLKYTWRFQHKENALQDMKKALWYGEKLKARLAARQPI